MTRRPRTVVAFERLVLLAFLLRIAEMTINPMGWRARIAMVDVALAPGLGYAMIGFGASIPVILSLWAARRGSRLAAWLFVVWVWLLAFGFAATVANYGFRPSAGALLPVLILVIYAIATGLIFMPASRRWFRGERSADEIARDFT